MISWLSSLFNKDNHKILRVPNNHKKYVRLCDSARQMVVIDYTINKIQYKELAKKYDVSVSTVSVIIRKARNEARRV